MKKLYIETYGCQMNVADSEVVASVMKWQAMTYAKKRRKQTQSSLTPVLYVRTQRTRYTTVWRHCTLSGRKA